MQTIKLAEKIRYEVVSIEKDFAVIQSEGAKLKLLKTEMTKELSLGETLDVFLYIDHQKHLAATMKVPLIDTNRPGLVEVVQVVPGLGVFVDIGWSKDVLFSLDDLSFLKKQWPQIGDRLFCILRANRNQIIAKPLSRYKMSEYFIPTTEHAQGCAVPAYVFAHLEEGLVLFTAEGHEIFVYHKLMRKDYRIGEEAEVTITIKKDHNHYNGTLIENKELMLDKDAERLLDYMQKNGGTMPYTDKTSAPIITEVFKMSKSAFKRALGVLYKERKIVLEEKRTRLMDTDETKE